jgi:hypothetical protein
VEKDIERTEEEWNDKQPSAIYDDRKAVEKLKNNKSPGPDNIIAEQCEQNR